MTPASFFGVEVGRQFDVALPLCTERPVRGLARSALDSGDWWWLAGFGRLKPGITVQHAEAELRTLSAPIFAATLPTGYVTRDADNSRSSSSRRDR
ncbi:MAG: hypothetical protein IPL75_13280 [Acidobacteria bacterium]|nr:hypothetical protein [Acidobacteriota bacterium]